MVVALEQSIDRLADDHVHARRLAEDLHRINPDLVNPAEVTTNIVMVNVGTSAADAQQWADVLFDYGVLTAPAFKDVLRFVTHRHIGAPEIERAVAAFRDIYLARPATLFAT